MLTLTVPAAAQFSTQTVLPMATRPGGPFGFSAFAVPVNVRGVIATVDVTQATDPLPAIAVTLEGSRDGGATWIAAGSFTRPAKAKGLNNQGQPLTQLGAIFLGGEFWQDTQNAQRQIRGTGTLGGSMRFALTVTPQ